MFKELAKWLMDIAKYMMTALLLSTIFSGLPTGIAVIAAVVGIISTLGGGLLLFWFDERKKERRKV